MSLCDYCTPDPPLECPRCDGVLTGWETRNEGSRLLEWQQGIAAPIGQRVDPDIAARPERRAEFRLPHEFTIFYGECSRCGYEFRGSAVCTTDALRVWRTLVLVPQPLASTIIELGWLQCPACCDAFELRPPKRLYICPSCQGFVRDASNENTRNA